MGGQFCCSVDFGQAPMATGRSDWERIFEKKAMELTERREAVEGRGAGVRGPGRDMCFDLL